MAMNSAGPPPFDCAVPDGGYRWWYLDALDAAARRGIVIIAFVGSVFSPYYFNARKRGAGTAQDFCALNVGLYRRRGKRWCMTERRSSSVLRGADFFRIGPSRLAWRDGEMSFRIRERCAPLGQLLSGEVRAKPRVTSDLRHALHPSGRHHWEPWAPLTSVRVDFSHPGERWEGTGYMDSNSGDEPLEAGFSEWNWSRACRPDGTEISYEVTTREGLPRSLSLHFPLNGDPTQIETAPGRELGRGLWGVSRPVRSTGATAIQRNLEDTPFYTRSLLRVEANRSHYVAVHESLSLDRFRRGWVRTLLPFRMPRELRSKNS